MQLNSRYLKVISTLQYLQCTRLVGSLLFNDTAQTSYIVLYEYEIYHVGPGDKTNTS